MSRIVFDSFALLEWLLGQPQAPVVRELLERASAGHLEVLMSWINVGETAYMVARKRGLADSEKFLDGFPSLPIRALVPDVDDILEAARLKVRAKLAYADAFAVCLAVATGAELVTGDPEIRNLGRCAVRWIGALT